MESPSEDLSAEDAFKHVYERALSIYESMDNQCVGILDKAAAIKALKDVIQSFKLAEPQLQLQEFDNLADDATLSFPQWLSMITSSCGDTQLGTALRDSSNQSERGLRCVCGLWMRRTSSIECYPTSTGGISCDFSGEMISGQDLEADFVQQ